jgi:signal transduction histidine kinase
VYVRAKGRAFASVPDMITTEFRDAIAERMCAAHQVLAERWFERLTDLLPVEAESVFPTENLLDHIPALIVEISGYLRQPDDAIAANTALLEKARELGALRHDQRASLHQVLREYQVLNGVLVTFVREEIERLGAPPAAEAVLLILRLNQAVDVLMQSTVEAFVALYTRTIADQKERLEQFTRMASHEWRQPLSALQVAVGLLRHEKIDAQRAERTLAALERNVQHLVEMTQKLEAIARMHDGGDSLIVQEVSAATVAREAARQLRDMAEAHDVGIRIADDLPALTVDVGRLELVFVNLLSNAIKYSDPAKPERVVDIAGTGGDAAVCRISVRDNGVGIPRHALAVIFQRFTRGHAEREDLSHLAGLGLGLSIVDDCVRAIGGRIDVESVEGEGTVFTLTLPKTPGQNS